SDEALKRVMAYVQENYQNSDLSVTEVAQRMDMQVSTLSRLFKKKTGQGLLEYINGLRVQEVIQKLQETNRSIGDIAADMGFINVNTMIRIFKRYTGCTPGRYRQMLTQNKEE
ncbi:MAG: AraC family transcriptional regulator, partial [Clostridia bacterium]